MSSSNALLTSADIDPPVVTPCVELQLRHRNGPPTVLMLKLEQFQRSGSMKYRTAVSMIERLHGDAPLLASDVLIESSSGNLALALADIARGLGLSFRAVIDPKTPAFTLRALDEARARTTMVSESDGQGGYLLTRLHTVEDLVTHDSRFRWTNQYENDANPDAHSTGTAQEILRQLGTAVGRLYVPVSTGGMVSGLSQGLRSGWPHLEIVAVDAVGSVATGGEPGRRVIPGLGSSRRSEFPLAPRTRVARAKAAAAIAACRWLRDQTGLSIGGSSGACIAVYLADCAARRGNPSSLIVCPDGGKRYADTIFDDDWVDRGGFMREIDDLARTWTRDCRVASSATSTSFVA
jgi:N-(2-amino-2-carboxyethyl)-L-glutamate synthase